jgi:transcriptional regulator with XRE-family HTH domain
MFSHEKVKQIRMYFGESIQRVSTVCGISPPTYEKKERGLSALTVPFIRKLSALYEVPIEVFFANNSIDVSDLVPSAGTRGVQNPYDVIRIEQMRQIFGYSKQTISMAINRSLPYLEDRLTGKTSFSRADIQLIAALFSVPDFVFLKSYRGSIEQIVVMSHSRSSQQAHRSALQQLLYSLAGLADGDIQLLQALAKALEYPGGRDQLLSRLSIPRVILSDVMAIVFPSGFRLSSRFGELSQEEFSVRLVDTKRIKDIEVNLSEQNLLFIHHDGSEVVYKIIAQNAENPLAEYLPDSVIVR